MQIKSSLNNINGCCAWIWILFLSLHLRVVICYFWKLHPSVWQRRNGHSPSSGSFLKCPLARLRNNIHRGKGQKVKCQWTTKDRVKIMRQWSAVHTHFSCKAALIIGHLFPQSWQVPPSSHLLMSFDTCYGYRLWSSNFHVIISPSYFFWQLRKSVNCRVKGYQFLVCTFC